MYLSLSLSLSLYLSSSLSFCWSGMFSYDPNQFCRVSIWSGRPGGFESNTMTKQSVSDQGRPRAARAAKNIKITITIINHHRIANDMCDSRDTG